MCNEQQISCREGFPVMANLFTCKNSVIKQEMETWQSQHEDEYCRAGATKARGLSPRNRAALWCKAVA